jgi:hypothetical protein
MAMAKAQSVRRTQRKADAETDHRDKWHIDCRLSLPCLDRTASRVFPQGSLHREEIVASGQD